MSKREYFRKIVTIAVLGILLLLAIFVRTYKFDDWLYFKMDQSRDALLMSNAIENGPGFLPLLGPRAGATELKHGFLRLGPAYYYFQYIAGKIANSTEAPVFAYPDLFFSILTLPLLYLFLRLYFSRKHTLLIVIMYAFSFIIIQYSRFAWNPNSLQFFLLLTFYGLLRFLSEKENKKAKWWLALWALGITIGSQLHFFGFFSLLGVSGLMFAFQLKIWKKETWKSFREVKMIKKFLGYFVTALAVFVLLYSPVIISDVMRGGENTHNFFEALGSKAEKKPLGEKIVKGAKENLKYYCLVTTSECYGGITKKDYFPLALTSLILLGGLVLVVRNLRREKKIEKKNFLILMLVWLAVFSILTIPVSFQLRPRFFIVVFATPFIFLGLFFDYLEERFGKKALLFSILLVFLILGFNFRGTYAWFKEQSKSQRSAFTVKRTLILKAKDGVTLGQLQGVVDWIYGEHKAGATLYYYIKPEHVRPIEFLLESKKDNQLNFTSMTTKTDPNAQFFAITPVKNGITPVTKKFGNSISILKSKQFGQLTVYKINFGDRLINENSKLDKNKPKSKEDRIFWKDVFNFSNTKQR